MGAKFTWFEKFTLVLDKMPEPDRTAMMAAIISYGTYGVEPGFDYPLSAVFEALREDVDNSVGARTANKGGRPRKAASAGRGRAESTPVCESENGGFESAEPGFCETETQTNPIQANPIQTNREEKAEKGAARFRPPTAEEVAAYAEEKGLDVDAARFCDFYATKGWTVGRSKMRDWKAAARNWAARDRTGKGAASARDPDWLADYGG